MHLRDYEDVINAVDAYSLMALVGTANKAFGVCSKVRRVLNYSSSYSDWNPVSAFTLKMCFCTAS